MEKVKAVLNWVKNNFSLCLALLFGALIMVIKLLWNRNAELKAENVAAEARGELKELKKEDESATKKADDAISDYERIKQQHLKR